MRPNKQQTHLAKQRLKIAGANKKLAQKTKAANEVVGAKRKASSELAAAPIGLHMTHSWGRVRF